MNIPAQEPRRSKASQGWNVFTQVTTIAEHCTKRKWPPNYQCKAQYKEN